MFNFSGSFSDFINRILVSQRMGLKYVFTSFSKFFISVLKILKLKKYIDSFFIFFFNFRLIIIKLRYCSNKEPLIFFFKRISRKNLKIYRSYKNIPNIMNGFILVSTNKGVLTGDICKKIGIGGEIICHVF